MSQSPSLQDERPSLHKGTAHSTCPPQLILAGRVKPEKAFVKEKRQGAVARRSEARVQVQGHNMSNADYYNTGPAPPRESQPPAGYSQQQQGYPPQGSPAPYPPQQGYPLSPQPVQSPQPVRSHPPSQIDIPLSRSYQEREREKPLTPPSSPTTNNHHRKDTTPNNSNSNSPCNSSPCRCTLRPRPRLSERVAARTV